MIYNEALGCRLRVISTQINYLYQLQHIYLFKTHTL